jgi:hypothetical protein
MAPMGLHSSAETRSGTVRPVHAHAHAHASYHVSSRGFHERCAPEDGDYVPHSARPDQEHLDDSGKLDPRHALVQCRQRPSVDRAYPFPSAIANST